MDSRGYLNSVVRISLPQLERYLRQLSREVIISESGRWRTYILGLGTESVEVVIPETHVDFERRTYVRNAIEALSAIKGEDVEMTILRIETQDRDLLLARVPDTEGTNSVSLADAEKYISHFKSLVAFSAASEEDPRPFFKNYLGQARNMIHHYRFGHTFRGSFGFTIESPIVSPVKRLTQHRLFEAEVQDEPSVVSPIERRVMERIVRGLYDAQNAAQQDDVGILLDGYASGLNANMCNALAEVVEENALRYEVFWSPTVEVSDDVAQASSIELSVRHYGLLLEANRQLKRKDPETVNVQGYVTSLSAEEPLRLDARRTIEIKWHFRQEGAPMRVLVDLSKDDYIEAHKAHLLGHIVEVRGVLAKAGNSWRLGDPQGFRIWGPPP